jgi:WD40 repeat protein
MEKKTAPTLPSPPLLRTLRENAESLVTKIAWSPDGSTLAVPTQNGTVELWDVENGNLKREIKARSGVWITSVAWAPDGDHLAVGSGDRRTRIWRTSDGRRQATQSGQTLTLPGNLVAWSPTNAILVTINAQGRCAFWNSDSWSEAPKQLSTNATCLSFSVSGILAVGTSEGNILTYGFEGGIGPRMRQPGVRTLAWSPDAKLLAGGSSHGTVCLFDGETGSRRAELEGHTRMIRSLSFSSDGTFLASKSEDGTVRIWCTDPYAEVEVLAEPTFNPMVFGHTNKKASGLAFHPHKAVLATLGNWDRSVRIWDLSDSPTSRTTQVAVGVRYTTAKVVLVGDSGVGKTGLGWRLAHGEFREHPSTHGQQFWVLDRLRSVQPNKTECEAVLWDFAGQPDYRLTHTLFLDRVDLALILFDPGNQSEPLKGVEYWLKALDNPTDKPCSKILVAARVDRASPTLTRAELDEFCRRHGIQEGFVATSALAGQGIEELLARMTHSIAWDTMPFTVTTDTFKRIKEFVLSCKESSSAGEVLLEPAALQSKLHILDGQWDFTTDEMMAAVQHLANHGYVAVLQRAVGGSTILLRPEVLSNLASSFVLEARRNPAGLGALEEAPILRGEYRFPDIAGLDDKHRETLLDAVTVLFLQRNVCFRERLGPATYLIFPSLINQKKPTSEQAAMIEDVSYTVTGRVENIYAALVVLLGYSNTFTRTNQWQNQAEYEMNPGEICGFKQTTEQEGEIDLVHYYGPHAGAHVRSLFQGLFETFLLARDVTVTKYAPVVCPNCHYRPERTEVIKRIKQQKVFVYCGECSNKIVLPTPVIAKPISVSVAPPAAKDQQTAKQRTIFETALSGLKGIQRDRGVNSAPACFISYAWGNEKHEKWVLRLAKDLENADIEVVIDRRNNAAVGSSISAFVNRIERFEFVLVVGTPEYLEKYKNLDPSRGTFVAAEMDILNQRLTGTNRTKESVLPVLLAGSPETSFPPLVKGKVFADFRREEKYFVSLFDLVLALCRITIEDESVYLLRQSIEQEEEYVGS